MTTIFNVDPGTQAWQQPDAQRQPEKDFAHALAERQAQEKADQQASSNSAARPSLTSPLLPSAAKTPVMLTLPAEQAWPLSQAEAQAVVLSETEQLTQATVTPTGVTETLLGARVYGWHAMAQAYLSELMAADRATDKASATGKPPATSELEVAAPPHGHANGTTPSTLVAEDVAATPQAEIEATAPVRDASDSASAATVAELASADSSAAAYWPERSLRYTRQRDGGSVAWLRDFRLGNSEAARLIQFVLNDAKAKGMAISKIMLNGREAWASPNGIQGARHDG